MTMTKGQADGKSVSLPDSEGLPGGEGGPGVVRQSQQGLSHSDQEPALHQTDAGTNEGDKAAKETQKPVNILSIDAIEFAAATAQMTAGRLFVLLRYPGEAEFVFDWFEVREDHGTIRPLVKAMATYVCQRRVTQAEVLYNHARMVLKIRHRAAAWAEEAFDVQQAWMLFQETCLSVYSGIHREQQRIRQAAELEARENPPLRREDSIFEEEPGLGDMIPGVAEEQARAAKATAEDEAKREAERKAAEEASASGDPDQTGAKPAAKKQAAKKPKPMRAGETVARKPVNRGGRGRKKAPAKTD